MGLSQSYPSQNTQVQFLRSENPTGSYVSLWILEKSTPWLQKNILTIITQSALCQTQHNTWQENLYSANLTALRLTIVCRWRTNGQWKGLLSILPAESLPTEDLHKAFADLCLPFQASCASIWTQLSKLSNVLNTWMILESQPITPRIQPGTFGQSPSAFAMQDWNSQSKSATLESGKLNFLEEPFHPREYHHSLTRFKISFKNEVPQIEEGFAAISGVCELLQKLHSKDAWRAQTILLTLKSRSPNQDHFRIERNLWFSKQSNELCLRTTIETTHSWNAVCLNDGRKLQKRRLCPNDWRQSKSENPIEKEDSRACCFRIKIFLPRKTKHVDLLERIFGNLHGISWVCTHFVRSNKTSNSSDG